MNWDKIFIIHISDNIVIFRIYNELLQLHNKKKNNLIESRKRP